VETAYYNRR